MDRTLPSIVSGLEVDHADPRYSERALLSDEDTGRPGGPATINGGVSAYLGDRQVPKGRPDLQAALEAQRRRLDRGQGYGHG